MDILKILLYKGDKDYEEIVASYSSYEEFGDFMRDFVSQPKHEKRIRSQFGVEAYNLSYSEMWKYIYSNEKVTIEFINYCLD